MRALGAARAKSPKALALLFVAACWKLGVPEMKNVSYGGRVAVPVDADRHVHDLAGGCGREGRSHQLLNQRKSWCAPVRSYDPQLSGEFAP